MPHHVAGCETDCDYVELDRANDHNQTAVLHSATELGYRDVPHPWSSRSWFQMVLKPIPALVWSSLDQSLLCSPGIVRRSYVLARRGYHRASDQGRFG